MKSSAYAVSRMNAMYQARKNTVPGRTNARLRRSSSWNSGDRSIASQSTCRPGSCCVAGSAMSPPPQAGPQDEGVPLGAALTLLLARGGVRGAVAGRRLTRRRGLRLGLGGAPGRAAAAAHLAHLLLRGPRLR